MMLYKKSRTDAAKAMDFVEALTALQKACGVDNIKLSDYGVKYEELDKYAKNARETMGGLFAGDCVPLRDADVLSILQKSYQ